MTSDPYGPLTAGNPPRTAGVSQKSGGLPTTISSNVGGVSRKPETRASAQGVVSPTFSPPTFVTVACASRVANEKS